MQRISGTYTLVKYRSVKLARVYQEPITRSEQLPCAHVTAFSWTSLFLERFWRELEYSETFIEQTPSGNAGVSA